MIGNVIKKLFGTHNDRVLKQIVPIVDEINQLEPGIRALSDAGLRGKSDEFRRRLADGETVDDVLPEAF
ncbi:MAG: hypothetical protein HGA63_00005, partial [Syntrophobacteraceae bacterium]|nr:hypothetical protein [Syntrophobacteraceae bacterium]